jgi:AcrR family transcriptional regulator
MSRRVNTRSYDASRRQAAARKTRLAIIDAAQRLFVANGYQSTTMAAIADDASVAVDTIYATIGTKPQLFQLLLEAAISGQGEAVPALERDYVRAVQAEADPRRKLAIYAAAVRRVHERLAPLVRVLQQAAASEADLAGLWTEISERRARNMRLLATELADAGGLRGDLSIDQAADIIWATNSPELYLLLVHERGWDGDQFEQFLADTWHRVLLKPNETDDGKVDTR